METYGLAFPIYFAVVINVLEWEADGLVESLFLSMMFRALGFGSLDNKGWAWAYAVSLSLDTIVPYHLVGEALTCHIVPDVCLP